MRQQRITTSQQEVYLIYLMEHTNFAASKIKDGEFEDNWKELTKMLNNTLGPKKTLEEWKLVFSNWKNHLRIRAKKLKSIKDGNTGSDDKLALQKLTDVEKRALKMWKEDFQDEDIASILNEIENKDITITPINKACQGKKRKNTNDNTIIITSNTQLVAPIVTSAVTVLTGSTLTTTTPTPSASLAISSGFPQPIQLPITISQRTNNNATNNKEDLSELINIKLEPFDEIITAPAGHTNQTNEPILMQDIMDWARNFNVSQQATDALLNVLKVKRIKTDGKCELPTRADSSIPNTTPNALQQRLFTKVFARLDKMESHLVQRITVLERKVDMKHIQNIKVQNQQQQVTGNKVLATTMK